MPPEEFWDKLNESMKVEYKIKSEPNGELYIENPDGNPIFLNTNVSVDLSGYMAQQTYKRHYISNEVQPIYLGEWWNNSDPAYRDVPTHNKCLIDKKLLEDFFKHGYNKQLLEEENFDGLYECFEKYLISENYSRNPLYILTALLICSDIDFIPHLSNLTGNMFYHIKLNNEQRHQYHQRRAQLMADPNCTISTLDESVWTTTKYGWGI